MLSISLLSPSFYLSNPHFALLPSCVFLNNSDLRLKDLFFILEIIMIEINDSENFKQGIETAAWI